MSYEDARHEVEERAFEKTRVTAIRTACLYGMMTLIPPNFHICATYPPNNFYSTNQARHRESFS